MYTANGGADGVPDSPTLYLLFAGYHGHDRRGSDDLVATLASQREAREAFRQVRLQIPNRDGWAELAAVSPSGKVRRLGWFGREESGPRRGVGPAVWAVAAAPAPPPPKRRRFPALPSVSRRRGRSVSVREGELREGMEGP